MAFERTNDAFGRVCLALSGEVDFTNVDRLRDAVDSILGQGHPCELIVSHSGGGRAPTLLAAERPSVRVARPAS